MGPMMYGESAGMGIRSFTLGSFDNSPNDRASVSAFHVNMLPPYWRSLLGSRCRGNSLLGTLVQMLRRRKQAEKGPLKDESTPPGYKPAPPGYRYFSPRADSSPHYRRLLESETTFVSSRSFRRRALSIVLFAFLVIDLVMMYYGGYLSSWQLLTQPWGI